MVLITIFDGPSMGGNHSRTRPGLTGLPPPRPGPQRGGLANPHPFCLAGPSFFTPCGLVPLCIDAPCGPYAAPPSSPSAAPMPHTEAVPTYVCTHRGPPSIPGSSGRDTPRLSHGRVDTAALLPPLAPLLLCPRAPTTLRVPSTVTPSPLRPPAPPTAPSAPPRAAALSSPTAPPRTSPPCHHPPPTPSLPRLRTPRRLHSRHPHPFFSWQGPPETLHPLNPSTRPCLSRQGPPSSAIPAHRPPSPHPPPCPSTRPRASAAARRAGGRWGRLPWRPPRRCRPRRPPRAWHRQSQVHPRRQQHRQRQRQRWQRREWQRQRQGRWWASR